MTLSWTAANDNAGVTKYAIYRGTVKVGETTGATSYTDAPGGSGTFSYTVKALDAAGNTSPASNTASVTLTAPDTTAPTAPTALTATNSGGGVALGWTGSTDNVGVTAYEVHHNGAKIATLGKYPGCTWAGTAYESQFCTSSSLSWTDTTPGTGTLSYTVKAKDAAGNLSAASNTATVTR